MKRKWIVELTLTCSLLWNLSMSQRLGQGASDWYMRFHDFDRVKRNYDRPTIRTFHVNTSIKYHYAISKVQSVIQNPAKIQQVFKFGMVMPKSSLVSQVKLETRNKTVLSLIEESDWVKNRIGLNKSSNAKENGNGQYHLKHKISGHLELISNEDTNFQQFILPISLAPNEKVELTLIFEHLLERIDGLYVYDIALSPGQLVSDFQVAFNIEEEKPIEGLNVSVPVVGVLSQEALGVVKGANPVVAVWNVSFIEQFQFFGSQGFTGTFRLEYDTKIGPNELDLSADGDHFLHFYTLPNNMETIPKHVIILFDTSITMSGPKLDHSKKAVSLLLDQLSPEDYFNVLSFTDEVQPWNEASIVYPVRNDIIKDLESTLAGMNSSSKKKSNITVAVGEAVRMDHRVWEAKAMSENAYTLIVLLTDGHAYRNYGDQVLAMEHLKEINRFAEIPMFILGMGFDCNMDFLGKVGSKFGGLTVNIIEDLEVEPQLKAVKKQLDDIVVKDLKLHYFGRSLNKDSLTRRSVKTFLKGGSFAVAGKLDQSIQYPELRFEASGQSRDGWFETKPPSIPLLESCSTGRITLCSDFQLKGHCVTLNSSYSNLRTLNFNDKAASLNISGDCRWKAFDLTFYHGKYVTFNPGVHEALPEMFQMISSVRKIPMNVSHLEDAKVSAGRLERIWAYMTIMDTLRRTEQRSGYLEHLWEKSTEIAKQHNFLTPFTDMYLRDTSNDDDDLELSAEANDTNLVPKNFLSFSDLNPIMFYMENHPEIVRGWEALKTCKPPIQCKGNFHFEEMPEITEYHEDKKEMNMMLNCSGSITLFTKPGYDGEHLEVRVSLHQLYHTVSSQRMRSIRTSGDCCWLLFDQRFYAGNVEKICGNKHQMFWKSNVGSVKRLGPLHL